MLATLNVSMSVAETSVSRTTMRMSGKPIRKLSGSSVNPKSPNFETES
jgi:hypothetical protein